MSTYKVPRKSNAKYYLLSLPTAVCYVNCETMAPTGRTPMYKCMRSMCNEEEEEEEEAHKRSLKLTIGRSYGTYGVLVLVLVVTTSGSQADKPTRYHDYFSSRRVIGKDKP
ncbi:hypothetical protein M0804_005012 [Polistes exclamans]|nr:hypothetical protein M0804_005012 [Polistes exclamans]